MNPNLPSPVVLKPPHQLLNTNQQWYQVSIGTSVRQRSIFQQTIWSQQPLQYEVRNTKNYKQVHVHADFSKLEFNSCPACAKERSCYKEKEHRQTLLRMSILQKGRETGHTCIAMMNSLNPRYPWRLESAIAQTFKKYKKSYQKSKP